MEKIELDVKMTFEDMYRFNLYHVYHNSQGILSIVLAVEIREFQLQDGEALNEMRDILKKFIA